MKRIEIIEKKLNELRELDSRFSIFGSSRHKYQLNSKLTEREIVQIETENQINLSPEYKEMLKYLGSSGAGCGYGLEKLTLSHIKPPFIGTEKLLRNCSDITKIDCDMVNIDEISGYVKLFDYGCGMEYCLIVSGKDKGEIIFFDCDGRFEKIVNKSFFDIYEEWLDTSLEVLKRVQRKLGNLTLEEVIDSEKAINNYSVKSMISSILKSRPISSSQTKEDIKVLGEPEQNKRNKSKKYQSNPWWKIWKS